MTLSPNTPKTGVPYMPATSTAAPASVSPLSALKLEKYASADGAATATVAGTAITAAQPQHKATALQQNANPETATIENPVMQQ